MPWGYCVMAYVDFYWSLTISVENANYFVCINLIIVVHAVPLNLVPQWQIFSLCMILQFSLMTALFQFSILAVNHKRADQENSLQAQQYVDIFLCTIISSPLNRINALRSIHYWLLDVHSNRFDELRFVPKEVEWYFFSLRYTWHTIAAPIGKSIVNITGSTSVWCYLFFVQTWLSLFQ